MKKFGELQKKEKGRNVHYKIDTNTGHVVTGPNWLKKLKNKSQKNSKKHIREMSKQEAMQELDRIDGEFCDAPFFWQYNWNYKEYFHNKWLYDKDFETVGPDAHKKNVEMWNKKYRSDYNHWKNLAKRYDRVRNHLIKNFSYDPDNQYLPF